MRGWRKWKNAQNSEGTRIDAEMLVVDGRATPGDSRAMYWRLANKLKDLYMLHLRRSELYAAR